MPDDKDGHDEWIEAEGRKLEKQAIESVKKAMNDCDARMVGASASAIRAINRAIRRAEQKVRAPELERKKREAFEAILDGDLKRAGKIMAESNALTTFVEKAARFVAEQRDQQRSREQIVVAFGWRAPSSRDGLASSDARGLGEQRTLQGPGSSEAEWEDDTTEGGGDRGSDSGG